MVKNELEKLDFMIAHAKADINLCAVVYKLLEGMELDDQASLFEHFVKGFREISTDGNLDIPEIITDDKKEYLMRKYQRIVDGHLEEFLNTRPILTKKDFYKELINYIMNDRNLGEDGAREFAIFDCCIDKRLPYAEVDLESGIRMDNQEYRECVEAIDGDTMDRIKYILSANLEQKTERASLLIREIDKCSDEKTKTILLATILNRYEADAFKTAALAGRIRPSLADLLSD